MITCHSNQYGYLDLTILREYTEYANNLCEFVVNSIVLDYVVKISIRNYQSLIQNTQLTNPPCISLYNINLDADLLAYGEKLRRICAMSKSSLYDMKTTRIAHPTWTVRFPLNFKRELGVFACNLRHLVRKISQIEEHVSKANIKGEIVRYHAISTALTTVKYDLLTLYVTIRSGGLIAMKSAFLYPILSDIQRWLAYTYYQLKMILSSFPGSQANHSSSRRITKIPPKNCIRSLNMLSNRLTKTIELSEITETELSSIDEDVE